MGMLKNALQLLGIFWMGIARKHLASPMSFFDGKSSKMPTGHQVFFGLKMLENTSQMLGVFWVKNVRKCLVTARRFLHRK